MSSADEDCFFLAVSYVDFSLLPEPQSREDFLRCKKFTWLLYFNLVNAIIITVWDLDRRFILTLFPWQIAVPSLWTWPQTTRISTWWARTSWWSLRPARTPLTRTGSPSLRRCCARRVYQSGVTGRWSGTPALCPLQWPTRTSAERRTSRGSETTTNPGVWSARRTVTRSVTITWKRRCRASAPTKLECIWITKRALCVFIRSLSRWFCSTKSRRRSPSLFILRLV